MCRKQTQNQWARNWKIYITGNPKQIDTISINKKTKIFYRAQ